MTVPTHVELLTILEEITEPRRTKSVRHRLDEILFTALCGAVAGCDTWVEIAAFARQRLDWLRKFVPLEAGIPSHDTFGRLFSLLDTGRFAACLCEWTSRLAERTAGRVVAIDGKTLRNSFDEATGKRALHLVSAWSADNRLVLGQVACAEKSNEITAIPKLLELLDLEGAIVTIDAMGCQTEIAAQIVACGGDYLLAVKGNQPTLQQRTQAALEAALAADAAPAGMRRWVQKERRRGADEVREHTILPLPEQFPERASWKNLRSIGMVVRRRLESDGSETGEVRYYITSLPAKVRDFARAVRAHWGIENRLHWSLDVIFTEDASRIRKGAGPETTGLLRRVALSSLQQDTSYVGSLRVKRKAAGWSTDVLQQILLGNPE